MENLTLALLGTSALFLLFLLFKQLLKGKLKEKFCVICAAVVVTWAVLLGLSYLQKFTDKVLLAILMGESSLAVFYLLEKKEGLKLFRLPLLLSLVTVVYFLITPGLILESLLFVLLIWAIFGAIYLIRANPRLGKIAQKITACCRES
ncbi:hypothetical protein J4207_05725 [Candidatus Woesearchaeota archaeon]|nr:hypothetical protein [Candidatus Woesearchaeota archaeon]HLC80488.1 hypothetical protein [Candidatus Nanoarchaeia archaeon]